MKGSYTYEYPRPSLTVDVAVISLFSGTLELLLIERRDPPFAGSMGVAGRLCRRHGTRAIRART